jgi:WD40 repeat protein
MTGHGQGVVGVAYSRNGQLIASGGDDSAIRLWRASDGRLLKTLRGDTNHVYSVAFSPDSEWLASGGRGQGALATFWKKISGGSNGDTIRLWRVSDGALQQVLTDHEDDVFSVTFSADGQWLASSSEDKTVKLWRLERVVRR